MIGNPYGISHDQRTTIGAGTRQDVPAPRSVFERYNITDQSDTQEAGRLAGKFLAREHEYSAQNTSQNTERPN